MHDPRSNRTRRVLDGLFVLLGAVALTGVVAASGCGLGEVPATGANLEPEVTMLASGVAGDDSGGPGDADGGPVDPGDTKFGNVTGRILFEGTPPVLPLLDGSKIAAGDKAVCKPADIGNDALVVSAPMDGEQGLQNVFVWLPKPPKLKAPREEGAAERPVQVFDNKNCRFEPHCMVVAAGEIYEITNDDATLHNTHTFPGAIGNSAINTSVAKGQVIKESYKKSEKNPVFVKCDVHAWMKGYHLVVDDPDFAAVTKPDGSFELKGLPYGKHQLRIWHESGVDQKVNVTIDADNVTFEKAYGPGDFDVSSLPPSREILVSVGK